MKAKSSITAVKKTDRPFLCTAEGAIWMAEADEGFVCVDPLESGHGLGHFQEDAEVPELYDGEVTLSN